jgi:hypothetical protein
MKNSMRYLLGVFALVLITNFASAQYVANSSTSLGDGDNPYVGTSYTYTVSSDGGAIEWLVYSADDLAIGNLVDPGASTPAYTISGKTTASASIIWNTPDTYYLTYKETLAGCSTYRGVVVVVTANSFQLDLAADNNACNSEEGNVLDWVTYKTKSNVTTPLTFTVNMTKDASFSINSWQFNGAFTLPSGITTGSITSSEGSISVLGDTFTLTGLTSASITITYTASGLVTAGGNITLTASNGAAISVSGTTNDNASGDLTQIITLNPLPGSSNISF